MVLHYSPTATRSVPTIGKSYSYFFGSSSAGQIGWRMVVDIALAAASLMVGILFRGFYVGEFTLSTPFGEAISVLNQEFASNMPLFAATAVVMFASLQLYRPLPGARIAKRIINATCACGAGALIHLGAITLLFGFPPRGIILPSWTLLCLAVIAVRFARARITAHYHLRSRSTGRQNRIEDVLVVGGAGYIGSVLTRQLLEAGYRVRILDLGLFGIESLNSVIHHPRLEVITGDFRNVEHVVRSLRGMDAVVHLGAIVGDPACAVDQEATIAVNYEAAKMMAQLARANGVSRFVFASTCSVYGASNETIDENSSLHPVSLYATTKIDAERALLESTDDVFQPTILRLATAYGWSYRPRFDLVANLLSAKAVTEREISVFNGEQWRPFVNTHDIARAILMVIEAPLARVGGEIFNVGDNSQNYTISQLGQIVADAVPGTKINSTRNDDDPRNYRVSFDKIQRVLGFRATLTLSDGIKEIVHAVQSGEVTDWTDPKFSNVKQMESSVLRTLKIEHHRQASQQELQATNEFLSKAA